MASRQRKTGGEVNANLVARGVQLVPDFSKENADSRPIACR
jgi:hypothetical protein